MILVTVTPTEPQGLVLLTFETRHYTFSAAGVTRVEAWAALFGLWRTWCQRNPDADPKLLFDLVVDVSEIVVVPGGTYVDRERWPDRPALDWRSSWERLDDVEQLDVQAGAT